MVERIPRHIVWSTDFVDMDDPFQRKWYYRQVLMNGLFQDIKKLDLDEVGSILDELGLPQEIYSLWKRFLETRNVAG